MFTNWGDAVKKQKTKNSMTPITGIGPESNHEKNQVKGPSTTYQLAIFKSVKVMKIKGRQRNYFRLEEMKKKYKINVKHNSDLDAFVV